MFLYKYKNKYLSLLKTAVFRALDTLLQFQVGRRTDEQVCQCALVPFLRARKANVPTLGPRFLSNSRGWGRQYGQMPHISYAPPPPPPSGLTFGNLMTDYYGAFSTSTSNFPGQIQSATIDTSYKSILTCLLTIKKSKKFLD